MNHSNPSSENKSQHIAYMRDTYMDRRGWILTESPSAHDIFEKYRRLKNYNGDIVRKNVF